MTDRAGRYKIQKRDVPFWLPRYRVVRTQQIAHYRPDSVVAQFWTYRGALRWIATGWWEDVEP